MKRLILWVVFTGLLLPGVLFAARQDVPHDPGDNSIVWGTATTPGTTSYILQQMFIELYGQFPTKWASGTVYTADNNSVVHGGNIYVCTTGHTAGATTEPGTGASWEDYWNYSGSAAAAAAVAAHIAGDPHPQYRLESEMISSAEISGTAYRVWYTDGSGNVTELALGADGTYLKSNGASAAPSFSTPSGSGDVVGPSSATDNAIAVYDNTTGKLIKVSNCTISSGVVSCTVADGSRRIELSENSTGNCYDFTGKTGFDYCEGELYFYLEGTPILWSSLAAVDSEAELEALLELQDLQGAVTRSQLPTDVPDAPESLTIFVEDDCTTASSPATGDLCFEY